ncbi:dual specificity protein phosphatase 10 [Aplochiton taeniatus]
MGLRTLGGCLSTTSTTNTSSSNSTVSNCEAGLLRPLGCASCSREAGSFESPAAFRKKLVGGCLPCTPLSSAAPLRALHSCVTGCNPKASQTGSSTCSYCSSDPIVVTFNPRRGKPPGMGRGVGAGPHPVGGCHADDDDYSVRTIWPEELSKKMTRSKTHQNHCAGMGVGVGKTRAGPNENVSNGTSPVILDCRNLLEFTRSQLTDHAGRRRLQQGKMAVLDFIGSGSGSSREQGRDSLKRLWNKGGEAGIGDAIELDDDGAYPRTPSPRSPSPQSPPSFSPPPSAPGTLIKPKPRQRDRDGGHSLPSAQSLHLVLNSLNREQDEENSRVHLNLPLSSSLPASLSDESVMTPDVENAVVSAILPFLFLGNERDAQDLDLVLRLNVGYVVNVTTHLPLYHLDSGLIRYKRLPATDNSKQNLRQYFEEVFEFIEEAHQSGRGVLVHCQAGVSRSATMVIAYLMKHTLMTMTDAYKYVRGRRPVVSPNLNFMGQLLEFERDLNSGVTPRILTPKLSGLETQV